MHKNLDERLLRQKLEIEELLKGEFVERDKKISERELKNNLIKVFIGPRRAGKSFYALQAVKGEKFGYLNFDEEEFVKVRDYDLFLKGLKSVYGNFKLLLLDEVQNLDRWELFVNRLQRSGYNLLVTGSNSKLLSRELATHLTGRHIPITLLQFSFREFLRARKAEYARQELALKEKQGELLNLLKEYMQIGGFPEIIVKSMDYRTYLKTLFDNVIFKDAVKRHNIRFSAKFYDLARYMMSIFSSEFSFTKTKNVLGLGSVHTVENYMKYLEETFLFIFLEKFSFKAKERLRSPLKKVYAIDTGLANALSFRTSENTGKLMENLVAVELARRSDFFERFKVFYWKDAQHREVDFVVKGDLKVAQLIQVTYASGKDEIEKREIDALVRSSKELGCNNLLVITWDYNGEQVIEGKKIRFVPLWSWLLLE